MALDASSIMQGHSSGDDDAVRTGRTALGPEAEFEPRPPEPLEAVVVRYENRLDRRTIYPTDCADEVKITTWLSANTSAFVDLGEYR